MSLSTERLTAALADRYRIERELGEGGMATVYLAEDLKHKRKVALKVLKPELAAVLGAERFVQEITTTAALQHPHILPLFDSGTADGFLFYVMPFIDGETLRGKLDRERQLGVDEAVKIATEVADALHYAHEQGVIHRDIKPENILLANGRPMVADFGIALALSAAAGGRMTETGLSLGTPHYMSPEQATAEKDISARSDVYSLASVLYEMLAGQPPHLGGSAQQIIMKIIAEPVELVTRYRKSVPANVAAALAKGLEKLPADRFATAREFAGALGNPGFALEPVSARLAAGGDWRRRAAVPALALAGTLALISGWALTREIRNPSLTSTAARYRVQLADNAPMGATNWTPFAVSPDGLLLAYVGEDRQIFLQSRDQLDATLLGGTDQAFNPFFSPDGTQVGYMSGAPGVAEIKVVPLDGGPVVTVTTQGVGGPGAAWGYDGYIYFDNAGAGGLRRVPAQGGAVEAASTIDSAGGEQQHIWPHPLPNGRGMLFSIDRGGPGATDLSNNDIGVLDLRTGAHRVLARGLVAHYMAPGYLLYVTDDAVLMAAPFDQDRLEMTGPAFPIVEGINVHRGGGGAVDLAVSHTGTFWYHTGTNASAREVMWASMTGTRTPIDSGWRGAFSDPALSPDGTLLALAILEGSEEHIWVRRFGPGEGQATKLTFDGSNSAPTWSVDGSQLAFRSQGTGVSKIWTAPADGRTLPTLLYTDSRPLGRPRWSPDGDWLVYERRGSGRDIFAVRPGIDSAPTPLLESPTGEQDGSVSPDGRWLLYEADMTGLPQVYLRPFPNTAGSLRQVSTTFGAHPRWSPDGRAIYYRNGNHQMVRATVLPGATLTIGEQRILFSLDDITEWEPHPDGTRFLVVRDLDAGRAGDLVVVEGITRELVARTQRK